MPLSPGDVTILSIEDRQMRDRNGAMVDAVVITIQIRDRCKRAITLPRQGYSSKVAEAEIDRMARDEIALLEKYS